MKQIKRYSWKQVLLVTFLAGVIIVAIFFWIGLKETSLTEVIMVIVSLFLLGKWVETRGSMSDHKRKGGESYAKNL